MKFDLNLVLGLIFSLISCFICAETEPENSIINHTNPLSRRTLIARRKSECSNASDEPVSSTEASNVVSFDEYDVYAEGEVDSGNPLPDVQERFRSITRNGKSPNINQSEQQTSIPLLFPVEKPMIPSETSFTDLQSFNDDLFEEDSNETTVEELIGMIPDNFIVTDTGGIYQIYSDDAFMTSAEIMKKRSALYRLLAEVYLIFDTFDFDGFMEFIMRGKSALKHLSLRYQLVENLVQRSLKTSNEGTFQALARFIEIIDAASIDRTIDKTERENFYDFEKRLMKTKSSGIIKRTLANYFTNEKKRINPLRHSLRKGDFSSAKTVIESSEGYVFVSMHDFMTLLGLTCSSARFNFISWAIENGHFDVGMKDQSLTPLMLAAKSSSWSNDIVKAILWKAPEAREHVDSSGLTALDHAKANKSLKKSIRKQLIAMLKLREPTYESLNDALNKK